MQKPLVIIFSILCLNATAQESHASKNLIMVSPVSLTQTTPTAFGAQYERFIGNSGKWSVSLPASYSFGHASACDPTIKTRMLRAYPGVKYYPAGNEHMFSYAIGANAVVGTGNSNCNCNDMGNDNQSITGAVAEGSNTTTIAKPFTKMTEVGMLLNNSINIQATQSIFIGSDLGIGGSYINYNKSTNLDVAFRFNFNIGYKF